MTIRASHILEKDANNFRDIGSNTIDDIYCRSKTVSHYQQCLYPQPTLKKGSFSIQFAAPASRICCPAFESSVLLTPDSEGAVVVVVELILACVVSVAVAVLAFDRVAVFSVVCLCFGLLVREPVWFIGKLDLPRGDLALGLDFDVVAASTSTVNVAVAISRSNPSASAKVSKPLAPFPSVLSIVKLRIPPVLPGLLFFFAFSLSAQTL